jgi:ABC-type glycerol-3-phosphate transport system substrate-binding protein
MLPGSKQAYRFATKSWEERGPEEEIHVPLLGVAGRMAAVSSSTADQKRAQGFVIWLSSREASDAVGPKSAATTLFRTSQVAAAGPWTGGLEAAGARQYAEVLSNTLGLPRALGGVMLPGRLDYLAALDRAVQQAVRGEKQPAEALGEAAAKWRETTEKLGIETQRKANARSLGEEGA